MQPIIVDQVPVEFDVAELSRRLHVRPGSSQAAELGSLVEAALPLARPKALGGIAYLDARGADFVVLDGVRFESRVLAVNLADTHRVFPFVATCGVELEEWAESLDDVILRYWSEAIREAAMRAALRALSDLVDRTFAPGETSRMSPGSLVDWPIEQQRPLFQLLGDPRATIGVELTDSLLMVPSKSVSGLRFGHVGSFESCMLCPREACPNRRAPYDPELYERTYRVEAK